MPNPKALHNLIDKVRSEESTKQEVILFLLNEIDYATLLDIYNTTGLSPEIEIVRQFAQDNHIAIEQQRDANILFYARVNTALTILTALLYTAAFVCFDIPFPPMLLAGVLLISITVAFMAIVSICYWASKIDEQLMKGELLAHDLQKPATAHKKNSFFADNSMQTLGVTAYMLDLPRIFGIGKCT